MVAPPKHDIEENVNYINYRQQFQDTFKMDFEGAKSVQDETYGNGTTCLCYLSGGWYIALFSVCAVVIDGKKQKHTFYPKKPSLLE
ncbi:hypothetical protein H4R19_003452 [Coemansia spiralis]|nr:hypothetical protein H4R19_003452 [Coemansia spiralis]